MGRHFFPSHISGTQDPEMLSFLSFTCFSLFTNFLKSRNKQSCLEIDQGLDVYTVNVLFMKTKKFPCIPLQLSVNISSVLHVFVWMVRRENQMRRDIPARVADWCHLEERGWRANTMSVLHYRKIGSSNTFRLEAQVGIFRLLM